MKAKLLIEYEEPHLPLKIIAESISPGFLKSASTKTLALYYYVKGLA